MQQKAIDAIREVDSKSLIWYEPVVISQFANRVPPSRTPATPTQG